MIQYKSVRNSNTRCFLLLLLCVINRRRRDGGGVRIGKNVLRIWVGQARRLVWRRRRRRHAGATRAAVDSAASYGSGFSARQVNCCCSSRSRQHEAAARGSGERLRREVAIGGEQERTSERDKGGVVGRWSSRRHAHAAQVLAEVLAQAPHAKALAALRIASRNTHCRAVLLMLLFPISDNGHLNITVDTSEQAPVFV